MKVKGKSGARNPVRDFNSKSEEFISNQIVEAIFGTMLYASVRTMMDAAQKFRALAMADCEVAFDHPTLQLCPTDSSHCQIQLAAVAFPRGANTEECRPRYWMNDAFRDQRDETCLKGNGGLRARIFTEGI